MDPLLNHERVRALLREAEDASRLLERMGAGDTREIREALTDIHRDLGRLVHQIWRDTTATSWADTPTLSPLTADIAHTEAAPVPEVAILRALRTPTLEDFEVRPGPDDPTGEIETGDETDFPDTTDPRIGEGGEDVERWYTDEVDWDGKPQPLFGDGDLDEGTDRLPESTDEIPGRGVPRGAIGSGDERFASPGLLETEDRSTASAVAQLLGMLPLPTGEADASALAVETARVQWATTDMDSRWGEFSDPVRVHLLGLLAARARYLQERLDVDIGPRMALDRMRRYRLASGLAMVPGLVPERAPEGASWMEDAEHWHATLSRYAKL